MSVLVNVGPSAITSFDKLAKVAAGQLQIQSPADVSPAYAQNGSTTLHVPSTSVTEQILSTLLTQQQRAHGWPAREIYNRFLNLFPTAALVWQSFAESELNKGNEDIARTVYERSVNTCPHISLWISYIKYLKSHAPLAEFADKLLKAINLVGPDPRSSYLWRELLVLRVRVYNAVLFKNCQSQGLLPDPFAPPRVKSVNFLIPQSTSEQDELISLADDNNLGKLRTAYQQVSKKTDVDSCQM